MHGAFGLFGSNAVLLIAMAIVVLVLFWFSFREAAAKSRLVRVAFGMIVGGAIGNVVDRLHYGYVDRLRRFLSNLAEHLQRRRFVHHDRRRVC